MALIFELDRATPARHEAVRAAVDALRAGGLVVLPTETVPGIACRADDPAATARLFDAKRRSKDLGLPVMAATADEALGLAVPNGAARVLASTFWPGPLTIVLERSARSRSWALGDRPDTIALRVPDRRVTLAILAGAGPLAVSSANRSGRPPGSGVDELRGAFGDLVDVYVVAAEEGTPRREPAPSTVVDLTCDPFRIARGGPITEAEIMRVVVEGFGPGRTGHSVD
jgi:L-threonylcarbamoyladenylate synthase